MLHYVPIEPNLCTSHIFLNAAYNFQQIWEEGGRDKAVTSKSLVNTSVNLMKSKTRFIDFWWEDGGFI